MGLSIWHLILVLVVVFVLFGAGKLPTVMGDIGKGMRSLKEGMKGEDDDSEPAAAPSKKKAAKETTAWQEDAEDEAPARRPAKKKKASNA